MFSHSLLAALLVLSADPAPPARSPDASPPRVKAARISDAVVNVDGVLTAREWDAIPALPGLVQTAPRYGAAPTHPTRVKVAYGQKGLYVAFDNDDVHGEPRHVRGVVARRDQVPSSDKVALFLDPDGDGVTGYFFEVNASGAQADAYVFRDSRFEFTWDGVWSAATAPTAKGWSAELFIPWSSIRFPARDHYDFGLNVRRFVNENAETQELSPPPQGVPGILSYAARYEGATGIRPGLNLELRPFVSTRVALRRPPGSLDRSPTTLPNAGLEAKYGLRGNLILDLAINPDFGQAEVDPAVLNLGPFEVFFRERRQFFLESQEIFQTRFNLVNTRRIGNNPAAVRADATTRLVRGEPVEGQVVGVDPQTRILEAVRLTGEVAPGWRVGALTATTGPTFGVQRFPNGLEEPITVDPPAQWSVARVRREFGSQSYVGGIATSVVRFGDEPDAFTGGLDYAVRFRDRYTHEAQVIGTHDGKEAGLGTSMDVTRAGRNMRLSANGQMLTPNANFNDLGFMQFAGFAEGDLRANVYTAQPLAGGNIRRLEARTSLGMSSTFEGVVFRKHLMNGLELTTDSLWRFEVFGGGQLDRLDPFETRGNIPYRVPLHWWTGGNFSSPFNKRVQVRLNGAYGEQQTNPGPDLGVTLVLQPVDRLQAELGTSLNSSFNRPRWVTEDTRGNPIFGRADLISTNATLRLTVGLTPTLTLQSYNQLLHSTAAHSSFLRLDDPETLVPVDPGPYAGFVDQSLTAFISNSVLRWEYKPGAFFFAVYTHRSTANNGGMVVDWQASRAFTNLTRTNAAHEDILFLKLVHLFGL